MKKELKIIGDILPAATIAVLFVVILLLVMLSATSYRYANEVMEKNKSERALSTYVVSCIRENRVSDVEVRDFGGEPGIAIHAKGAEYERIIYTSGGKLLEEHVEIGEGVSPEGALVIGETSKFDVSEEDGLIRIETDLGVSYAYVS